MADPITREQVERAIELSERGSGISEAFGGCGWARVHVVPRQVVEAWSAIPFNDDRMTAALTRWRDELTAAEPVRRVARWDDDAGVYRLTPPYTHTYAYVGSTTKRETAIAWGYEIEGGPERLAEEERLACAYRESDGTLVWDDSPLPEPERPAPRFKVVDVPQPRIVVKRCDEVEAEWTSADATILIVTHDALDDAIFVPIALLRAMLADIDAQQGGAS